MKMSDIIANRQQLDKQLCLALSTMEKKDTIQRIRQQIIENQRQCPHIDNNYNWEIIGDQCPYCGMHFQTGGIVRGE